jgi:hypothetical protein
MEDYVGAPTWNRPDLGAQLTPEVWALYHTFIDSLLGIVWLLLTRLGLRHDVDRSARLHQDQPEIVTIGPGRAKDVTTQRTGDSDALNTLRAF